MLNYIFIDAEYAYACALRECGSLPNYKNILDMVDSEFGKPEKVIYHVGSKQRKQGFLSFLGKLGVDYNVVFDFTRASKTQLVGAAMAMDSMRICASEHVGKVRSFTFLTGDDYLIPIVIDLKKYEPALSISILYFHNIFSLDLQKVIAEYKIKTIKLGHKYFTFPKDDGDGHKNISAEISK